MQSTGHPTTHSVRPTMLNPRLSYATKPRRSRLPQQEAALAKREAMPHSVRAGGSSWLCEGGGGGQAVAGSSRSDQVRV